MAKCRLHPIHVDTRLGFGGRSTRLPQGSPEGEYYAQSALAARRARANLGTYLAALKSDLCHDLSLEQQKGPKMRQVTGPVTKCAKSRSRTALGGFSSEWSRLIKPPRAFGGPLGPFPWGEPGGHAGDVVVRCEADA